MGSAVASSRDFKVNWELFNPFIVQEKNICLVFLDWENIKILNMTSTEYVLISHYVNVKNCTFNHRNSRNIILGKDMHHYLFRKQSSKTYS